jgi:hypothetical protein
MDSVRLTVFFHKLRGFFLTTSFFMLKHIQTQRSRIGSNNIETAILTARELDRNTLDISAMLQEHTNTHYNKYASVSAEKLIAEYFSELMRLFHHKSSMPTTYSVQ